MDNTIVGIILSTVTCTDGIYLALLLDKYYDNSLPVVTLDNNDDIQEKAEKNRAAEDFSPAARYRFSRSRGFLLFDFSLFF